MTICTSVHTHWVVEFDRDPPKAIANRRKRGVDLADAGTVLHDEIAITIQDDSSDSPR